MFRFLKILPRNVNQYLAPTKNKFCYRSICNVENQTNNKSLNANFIGLNSLALKINQDLVCPKSTYFNNRNNTNSEVVNSVLYDHSNVFGYIKNYRQVYIENPNATIEMPPQNKVEDVIQAARLIVIRRRKMKKHKLKKLRKKMKFEWAKVRQRREMRKEKAFQAVLINQIKEAERFSAEQYVEQKLKQANEVPIPRFWKGRRLPAFIIKEKLGIK
ncbi:uncharacterized protein LOC129605246 [Condylostylus longicornis]|uniref:uncharacterized protein LOC129605246 n=1 Tax=Condylostylus longicornis TaxID=2530218 RepID=UPI00244E1B31|nr:uncharacterized protein LOC129605246 [Condylostylus longicornis]